MKQVGVHLLSSNATFDIEYTYLVEDTLEKSGEIVRGSFVNVPFGVRKKLQTAVVWHIYDNEQAGIKKGIILKKIHSLSNVRPPLSETEILLAEKMSKLYFCSVSACVRCMIPPEAASDRKTNFAKLSITPEQVDELMLHDKLKNINHIRILEHLKEGGRCISELAKELGCTASVFKTLEKHGYLVIEKVLKSENIKEEFKNSLHIYDKHELNAEQQKAYDYFLDIINKKEFSENLLHGVTGSGKTELYMQLISETVKDGGAALLLVPEISLTPQMSAHFKNRFGDNVAVLHSRLSDKERRHHWDRIKNGEVSIAIGARSAIFAPFDSLRLIIIDEEHEPSYHSEDSEPRYHATEVAAELAKIIGATVIYGSATPRVETYYRAINKEINYASLKNRANKAPLPIVEIVNMKEEREAGDINRFSIFSKRLTEEMVNNYNNGKQTMLFVHRRGYAKQLICKSCAHVMKCGGCSMPMTYHEKGKRLICHHCGRTVSAPTNCPACGGNFDRRGLGTQRVVEELEKLFPMAKILRMDTDTTSVKGGHEKILSCFASAEAQFLVGTQMIAKGHDFPNVTLAGIIAADSLINMPGFYAEERAFQLFTQMSGRAGRGSTPGKVIIQAYAVDDYALTAACNHDYVEFYRNEIIVREALFYPPFSSLGVLRFVGENDKETYSAANEFCGKMRARGNFEVEIFGPARAEVPKINNKYRWIVTIKARNRRIITEFLSGADKFKASVRFYGR